MAISVQPPPGTVRVSLTVWVSTHRASCKDRSASSSTCLLLFFSFGGDNNTHYTYNVVNEVYTHILSKTNKRGRKHTREEKRREQKRAKETKNTNANQTKSDKKTNKSNQIKSNRRSRHSARPRKEDWLANHRSSERCPVPRPPPPSLRPDIQ